MEPALNQIMEDIKLKCLQRNLGNSSDGLVARLEQEAHLMLASIRQG